MIEQRTNEKMTDERTYAEKVDKTKYTAQPSEFVKSNRFRIKGDDQFYSKQWEAMMKDCAFYYDRPTITQETTMRQTLQRKYSDDLFSNVMKPRLQSRNDLILWACQSQN